MTGTTPGRDSPSAAAGELSDLRQQVMTLQVALETSRVIGAAVGLLMADLNLSRHDAFRVLCQMSQHTNTKLVLIATRLVEEAENRPPSSK